LQASAFRDLFELVGLWASKAAIVIEGKSFALTEFNLAASSMESSIALCLHKCTRCETAEKDKPVRATNY